jgi:hypothetical protein
VSTWVSISAGISFSNSVIAGRARNRAGITGDIGGKASQREDASKSAAADTVFQRDRVEVQKQPDLAVA